MVAEGFGVVQQGNFPRELSEWLRANVAVSREYQLTGIFISGRKNVVIMYAKARAGVYFKRA